MSVIVWSGQVVMSGFIGAAGDVLCFGGRGGFHSNLIWYFCRLFFVCQLLN